MNAIGGQIIDLYANILTGAFSRTALVAILVAPNGRFTSQKAYQLEV